MVALEKLWCVPVHFSRATMNYASAVFSVWQSLARARKVSCRDVRQTHLNEFLLSSIGKILKGADKLRLTF